MAHFIKKTLYKHLLKLEVAYTALIYKFIVHKNQLLMSLDVT